jgi:hypothetical protein
MPQGDEGVMHPLLGCHELEEGGALADLHSFEPAAEAEEDGKMLSVTLTRVYPKTHLGKMKSSRL